MYLCGAPLNSDGKMWAFIKRDGNNPLVPFFWIQRQEFFPVLKVITCRNRKFRKLTENGIFLSGDLQLWLWRGLQMFAPLPFENWPLPLSVGLSIQIFLNHLIDLTIVSKPLAEEGIDCLLYGPHEEHGPPLPQGKERSSMIKVFLATHCTPLSSGCPMETLLKKQSQEGHQPAAHHNVDLRSFIFQTICWNLLLCVELFFFFFKDSLF